MKSATRPNVQVDGPLTEIDQAAVEGMSYADLVALLRETNRPPGGKSTIAAIARTVGIGPQHRVLEIGSNTGFTSFELAKLTGCRVHGIDISVAAVAEANRRLQMHPEPIPSLVSFAPGDATAIDAADYMYDMLICGGVNSFIDDAKKTLALREYRRVLKPYGFLSITNLFYAVTPPPPLIKRISEVIGTKLEPRGLDEWLEVFLEPGWELFELRTWRMGSRPAAVVAQYLDALFAQPHLVALCPDALAALRHRWTEIIELFNENHRYLDALMLLLRPEIEGLEEQPELFLVDGAFDRFFERSMVTVEKS